MFLGVSAENLPQLRQDLRLLKASPDQDGSPRWAFYDVLRNKYFYITSEAFQILQRWKTGLPTGDFVKKLQEDNVDTNQQEIAELIKFLVENDLTREPPGQATSRFMQQKMKRQQAWWKWLVHNYLFIRIPLFRPDAWLGRTLPKIHILFRNEWHWLFIALGVLGLVMAVRSWETFITTFMHFFSLEGLIFYALALIGVKFFHELAHAFTAKYYGCRVGSMGVAFLVMFPVLYTDVTDAWKLTSKRSRLMIVTAGIRVELYIAMLATFMWAFLPEGPLKSAVFFIATVSWVSSLLINITPFLRFDGYYAMSDAIGVENLQARGFAMGRWYLRKMVLGWHEDQPEPMRPAMVRTLVAYAWITWIYRFFLFIGIAILVYNLFFKALGLLLFVVEIIWFILLPVYRELKEWWENKGALSLNKNSLITLVLVGGFLVWGLLPLQTSFSAPAILKAHNHQQYFAPEPAQISELLVEEGQRVKTGDVLLELRSPQLDFAQTQAEERLKWNAERLNRVAASVDERGALQDLLRAQERLLSERASLNARQERLVLKASFDGTVSALAQLREGQFIDSKQPLLSITGQSGLEAEAFISEKQLRFLGEQMSARFIARHGQFSAISLSLSGVDYAGVTQIPYLELSSEYGGTIAGRVFDEGVVIPEQGLYRIRFDVENSSVSLADNGVRTVGTVRIKGQRRAWLIERSKDLWALLIRESGF